MKIEIDDTQLIDTIVEKVVERLKPLLNENSKSTSNEFMTTKELAIYLGETEQSIYDKKHTNSIPCLKYGKLLKFKKKHIDIWLRNPYHPDLDDYNINHNGRR